jgi:hypothetical protein
MKENPTLIEYALSLEGGELVAFDCKRLHGSHSTATQRWAIGMWRFNETWKAKARFGA